jgi:UDP-N-acetylmuramoyl-tripeptide--D-alanyl-D-alanine ligase
MRTWDAARVAEAAGATLVRAGQGTPRRAVIDSRAIEPGDLFVGLRGEHADGGAYAAAALADGAWGVLTDRADVPGDGTVLRAEDPLAALQALARAWRRELGVPVIAITGSVGKTSTKDLTAAMVAQQRRVHSSRANFNTEIGLPLEVLAAPPETEALVLELAMRGPGQIAELAAICEPDVAVITNVGPVHLELLGSIEAIAAAKAEIIAGLRPGATAVVPDGEALLEPHLRDDVTTVRFGHDESVLDGIDLPFGSAHMRLNAMAAVAAARAIGVEPEGRVDVVLSALRGERVELPRGAVVVNDCYNANPLSMRAALDDLAQQSAAGRRIAVLGDMLELGPQERELHREAGRHVAAAGVDVLVTVGPLAAEMADGYGGEIVAVADAAAAAEAADAIVGAGDVVLVKGSRGVGLEVVAERLLVGTAGS